MRSATRILAVFESFTRARDSLTLQEIADRIELPKSTAFRIVQSLEQAGYLVRLANQQYCLSFRFTRLAGLVKSTVDIRDLARPIIVELAQHTKETVTLNTLSGRDRVCIDVVDTASPLRSVTKPGEHIRLLDGSSAKMLMAYMPRKELAPVLSYVSRTTKRKQAELTRELTAIRERGYAVSHGERMLGLSAITAPIKDVNDDSRLCLTVAGPTVRLQPRERDFIKLVVKAAADISRRYGG
ncbi:MAG: IclR family transcriptional regulator [Burkholderiales bacterium]|nr:IclR family transcriptional regulator [Burkholderiales bacterium]